jgi:hypothetical protein
MQVNGRHALMAETLIRISAELTAEEALAFAQFLKRAGHADYVHFAESGDDEQAYLMLYAANKLREAFAAGGISPR